MKSDSIGENGGDFVLVTGASGFLGRHVARVFSQHGHVVRGIGHGKWPRAEWRKWGLSEWFCADVTLQTLRRYAAPYSIIHCAGSGSVAFSINDPLSDFERTVVTTAHVLEYIRTDAPTCCLVYPSSASVYGTVERIPIREDCPARPISQYGTHKLIAEQMVASHSRQFEISAAIVRLFSVYGCGLRKQLLWDACRKFANHDNTFMGTGDEVRDWLHVEDAAKLLLAAADHASPKCPIVNGGSGQGVTVRDLLLRLGGSLSPTGLVPTFSGAPRAGDPAHYVADITSSRAWGWLPTRQWAKGVEEYAAWWNQVAR